MIAARRTRLVRVPSLRVLQRVLVERIAALDPLSAADTFIVVPTRAAGEQLRRTAEDQLLGAREALSWPEVGPRADLYRSLALRADRPLSPLSPFDREVLLGRLAREVASGGTPPPFPVRPSLVAEMAALYDFVRRQGRTVDDFERNLLAELEPAAESDRGAAQLLQQTAFLCAVFRAYEQHLHGAGLVDEHGARTLMLAAPPARPLTNVIVAVGDRIGDPDGLWPVDFLFLSTVSGPEQIDIVVTEAALAAGLLDRVHAALPAIEEVVVPDDGSGGPVLVAPAHDGAPVFHARDREEELIDVARRVKAARRAGAATPLCRHALVVRQPLPYLYLARAALGSAGVPFETIDTLPLAAEPYAAALDLVLDVVISGYARAALVAVLRSPHFRFADSGEDLPAASVDALSRVLAESGYAGDLDRLAELAALSSHPADVPPRSRDERRRQASAPAARAALAVARHLDPLAVDGPAVDRLAVVRDFLVRYGRPARAGIDLDRQARVRAAVIAALDALERAFASHDAQATLSAGDLAAMLRRWLGAQTFAVPTGTDGLRVLDAQAARFADVDDVQLMGLVAGEWPEPARPSIFYPPALLLSLEPAPAVPDPVRRDRLRLAAARAAFHDLLGLARREVRVSTFALEADAVVEPSPFIDDLAASGLARQVVPIPRDRAVLVDEALVAGALPLDQVPEVARGWADLRAHRPATGDPRYAGEAGPWPFTQVTVTRVDRYLRCPFQFFASDVLRLEAEPEDEVALAPLARGRLLHGLFEAFFREWQRRGHGNITPATYGAARALLEELTERALATLPPVDADLERRRLLGSAAGAGIIDRVLSLEADRPATVRERLIEYALDDVFRFHRADGSAADVPLRAIVDRVDVLADGTFRVIDYKSRLPPGVAGSVQLPIYTSAVAQQMARGDDRSRRPVEALYLLFEGEPALRSLKPRGAQTLDDCLREAEDRLLGAIDDVRAGHFPARPSPPSLCRTCPYDGVCRKAFVEPGDE